VVDVDLHLPVVYFSRVPGTFPEARLGRIGRHHVTNLEAIGACADAAGAASAQGRRTDSRRQISYYGSVSD